MALRLARSALRFPALRSCNRTRFFSVNHIEADADWSKLLEANKNSKSLLVVDWFATWCGPCKMVAPHFEKMSKEHTDVTFAKVDVDQCEESASGAGISVMPTFQFYKQGQKIGELTGANIEKLASIIKQHK
eukprot:TRINITY_DN2436_c0_g2_i2.p2 TRINITY_DN2436_c0_g2~~TRINITY_DN2436_c0_g2_i2.p2  ORF type:complete len:132 (-),score=56.56 TRINITY_DN2436_c0_g2_i2:296-691(-)